VGGVGSGKSSCIAIPTLRAWRESVFAIDIKGELHEKSRNYRINTKVFNPLDENSYGYDPFFSLRTSHNPTQEARAIAQAIIPLPHEIKDSFWIESAQNIFTAAILHCNAQGLSFLETVRQIQSLSPKKLILELCRSSEAEARYCVNSLADMEDRVLSSIMAELSKNIVPFVTDRNLISALSRDKNISPEDLEYCNDVFINIPEHLLRQWKNLLTLIVNQFLTHFEQRDETTAQPILFLLDEFPRLGKVGAMLDGLATLRSKKISICLIVQSLAQLDTIYGQNERKVIADTCTYKAILGATDADTQEYFSRLAGTYDKVTSSHGTNREAYTGIGKGTSTNTSEVERRVIPAHEFGMLGDIVLFSPFAVDSFPFCRVEKLPYYL
jgi:type IV secretion system protein VirD4